MDGGRTNFLLLKPASHTRISLSESYSETWHRGRDVARYHVTNGPAANTISSKIRTLFEPLLDRSDREPMSCCGHILTSAQTTGWYWISPPVAARVGNAERQLDAAGRILPTVRVSIQTPPRVCIRSTGSIVKQGLDIIMQRVVCLISIHTGSLVYVTVTRECPAVWVLASHSIHCSTSAFSYEMKSITEKQTVKQKRERDRNCTQAIDYIVG